MTKENRSKNKKSVTKFQKYRAALFTISTMGAGLKPEIIDWNNIGKNAVYLAKDALNEKCKRCGK